MSVLYYTFIEFNVLLYTVLVIFLAQYKEYIILQILFGKFLDVLPACTSGSAMVIFEAFA